ncbi:MAG: T9SS type A sorting domain-containing protein [Bacteroidia bacterium]
MKKSFLVVVLSVFFAFQSFCQTQIFTVDSAFGNNGMQLYSLSANESFHFTGLIGTGLENDPIILGSLSVYNWFYEPIINFTSNGFLSVKTCADSSEMPLVSYQNIPQNGWLYPVKNYSDDDVILIGTDYELNFKTMKLSPGGVPDSGFMQQTLNQSFLNSHAYINDLASDESGIYVLALMTVGINYIDAFSIVKFNYNGEIDQSFGTNGLLSLDLNSDSTSTNIKSHYAEMESDQNGNLYLSIPVTINGNVSFNYFIISSSGQILSSTQNGDLPEMETLANSADIYGWNVFICKSDKIYQLYESRDSIIQLARFNNDFSPDLAFGNQGIADVFVNQIDFSRMDYSLFVGHDGNIAISLTRQPVLNYSDYYQTLVLMNESGEILEAESNELNSIRNQYANDSLISNVSWFYTPQGEVYMAGSYLYTPEQLYVSSGFLIRLRYSNTIPSGTVYAQDLEVIAQAGEAVSWEWFLNDIPFSGQSESIIPITQNGWYSAWFTTNEGCRYFAGETLITVAGSSEIESENLQIYPNPSGFTFNVLGLRPDETVTITDLSGRNIGFTNTQSGNYQSFKIEASPGIYLLSTSDGRSLKFSVQ